MTRFRTVLFWIHLTSGLTAGLVVLVMSVTGVLLTYEKQLIWWADTRHLTVAAAPDARPLPLDELLTRVRAAEPDREISTVSIRRDAAAPVALAVNGGVLYADPYTGQVLGTGNAAMRGFMRTVTDWHRWLGTSGPNRATGRAITGACNLAFLVLVLTGICLWFPRRFEWKAFKPVILFRRGLTPKARDFNWHNVIGFWSAVPLALIVASGVVISYPWASNLVYRAVGEAPPPPRGRAQAAGPAGRRENGAPRAERAREIHALGNRETLADPKPIRLDPLWQRARTQVADWQSISLRLPSSPDAPVAFTIGRGTAGQPHLRGTLTLNARTGAIERWETFDTFSRGRQIRSFLRFAHTGEIAGLPGQTVAGIVSAGAVVLVYSGFALSWRRFVAWRRRRTAPVAAIRSNAA